jgi:D-tyrosyl-tRNA(Tyr) deacylase
MRALIQRVKEARVLIENKIYGQIGEGMVVLLGVGKDDTEKEVEYLANKIPNLRIFEDKEGKFNHSVLEINGEVMVISQFTLYGDTKKGRRPDFTKAAPSSEAKILYKKFIDCLKQQGVKVVSGKFGERMLIDIHNNGPVTLMMEV